MIARSVLAALVAGILAGLLIAAVHHIKLSPLIAVAETFEHQTSAEHDHSGPEWVPAEGFQRIAATTVAWALTGAGFALLLAAVSLLSGLAITARNALLWGLGGFFAASLAPAAGLAPELPGMPAADLTARQAWWAFTVAATGLAMLILAKWRSWPWLLAALALIVMPHLIGAPLPANVESAVPATLAANYVGASLAVSALFWAVLGLALGWLLPKAKHEDEPVI